MKSKRLQLIPCTETRTDLYIERYSEIMTLYHLGLPEVDDALKETALAMKTYMFWIAKSKMRFFSKCMSRMLRLILTLILF